MAVAMAQDRRPRHFAVGPVLRRAPPRVALARQRRLEFRLQEGFDEGPDAGAHPSLQWVKPVRAEKSSVSAAGSAGNVGSVVMARSPPALQRRSWLGEQAGDYAALTFQPSPRRHRAAQANHCPGVWEARCSPALRWVDLFSGSSAPSLVAADRPGSAGTGAQSRHDREIRPWLRVTKVRDR